MAIAWRADAADARSRDAVTIDVSAATLPDALAELSREASVSIGSERPLPRLRTSRIHGRLSVDEALRRLLAAPAFVHGALATPPGASNPCRSRVSLNPRHDRRKMLPVRRSPWPILHRSPSPHQREQLIAELPMNVAVVQLSASERHDPVLSTDWVASEVEGLAQASAGPGRNRMFLRGIADSPFSNESQSTVAILLDDARVTYSAPDPGIRLIDVERVEVLKGPQGSLTLRGRWAASTRS
jgi:hypothetical protein